MAENVVVSIEADTQPFLTALDSLQRLSAGFGSQLTGALRGAVIDGRELDGVLRRIALNLTGMALNQGLQPLQGLVGSLFSGLTGGLSGALPFAKGGVVPFASGGVVSAPTYFPAGGGLGLMGEAGAEAILPLRRGADGRLGVAAQGNGGGPVNIVFNVTTQDAASFRKSEAQVTGMLARAVSRGMRTF
ncbi:phage tail tape measure protein [Mesorhizobium sp. LHD-90]|uniref:phage tail tape measure protein n=1 Tax=Mesorhizobium sp. LHD-90 TaxID=3071414 RepID=UPI0027DEBA66|nr:phage tail tape measure protein [Mesorhizobium sp. LHD-90]MDQ6436889.1 phage tail tape measure protein [Mesorhizobium sp. LHD-90]